MDTELQVVLSDFNWEQVQAVGAKTLYEFLELDPSNYSKWVNKSIVKNAYAVEWEDYILWWVPQYESTEFILTIDFAKRVAMKSNSKKWEAVRQYFLNIEKAFKKVMIPQLPRTFSQALLLASQQAEEIEKLEEMRAIDAPLVEFAKTVQNCDTDVSVEQFAKATFPKFWLGRNLMFVKLREIGFLKGDNLPYQQYVNQWLFRVIETVKLNQIYFQTLLTGKWQVLLEEEISKSMPKTMMQKIKSLF